MTPSWILDIFAALMLVVAAVSAGRLVVAQPWRQGAQRTALADIDVAHLLMAIAMAGMLTASLQTLPTGRGRSSSASSPRGSPTGWYATRGSAVSARWQAGTAHRTSSTPRRCCTCSSP